MAEAKNAASTEAKTIKLVVHANGDDDEQVMVNINGRQWHIKREHEVEVPPEVVEALRLATRPVKRLNVDPLTGKEVEEIEHVPRFPYSVRG